MKRFFKIVGISLAAIIILLVSTFLFVTNYTNTYTDKFYSCDRQYSIYFGMYMIWDYVPVMDCHGSGKVFLFDEVENELVATSHLGCISGFEGARWGENRFLTKDVNFTPLQLPRPLPDSCQRDFWFTYPLFK